MAAGMQQAKIPISPTVSYHLSLMACMQRRPDLLDVLVMIIHSFMDSAAPATQNGVSKMSTVLNHSDLDTSNRLD